MSEAAKFEKTEQSNVEFREQDYNILEIGVGETPYICSLKDAPAQENTHYIGVDISKKEMDPDFSRILLEQAGFTGKIDFLVCSGKRLPFNEQTFNEVVLRNVLDDSTTVIYNGFFDEAARLLKNKGKLVVIETYTPDGVKEKINELKIDNNFVQSESVYAFNDRVEKNKKAFILTLERTHRKK